MSTPFSLAIVGGGASGMMAAAAGASEAKRRHFPLVVTLYECNAHLGKKISVTGNGRCNLTNKNITENNYYGDIQLFRSVYEQFDNEDLISFFYQIGLCVHEDFAGRIYPMSNTAQSVTDALRFETERRGVKTVTETAITKIERSGRGFLLNSRFYADAVILATGSKAAPMYGSDGSGYELLAQMNQPVTPVFPALTALRVENFTKALKGIRAKGTVAVWQKNRVLASDTGEIQYTDYGLSGIPAMQVSRKVAELLYVNGQKSVTVSLDSAPDFSKEDLFSFLSAYCKKNAFLPCEVLLSGIMPKRLGVFLMSQAGIKPSASLHTLNAADLKKLINEIKDRLYTVSSVNGFREAQVCAGGADAKAICAKTLQSTVQKGLYIAGELLNIDGNCGGYNLQWAFSSGYVAGTNAVRELINSASSK